MVNQIRHGCGNNCLCGEPMSLHLLCTCYCQCSKNPRRACFSSRFISMSRRRYDAVWYIFAVSGCLDQRTSKMLVRCCKHVFDGCCKHVFNTCLSLVTDPWTTGVTDYESHCAWIMRYGDDGGLCITNMRDLVWPRKYFSLSMCGISHTGI